MALARLVRNLLSSTSQGDKCLPVEFSFVRFSLLQLFTLASNAEGKQREQKKGFKCNYWEISLFDLIQRRVFVPILLDTFTWN